MRSNREAKTQIHSGRIGLDRRAYEPFDVGKLDNAIDSYFDYCYGKLPYRLLEFKHETHNIRSINAAAVNHANEQLYTRVSEFKYRTGQEHPKTSIVYEFPKSLGDPYYPVPRL